MLAELLVQQHVPGAETLQSIIDAMIFFGVVFTSILVFVVNQPFPRHGLAAGPRAGAGRRGRWRRKPCALACFGNGARCQFGTVSGVSV